MLALERGDPETAAVLIGAFAGILENAGVALSHDPHWERSHETMTESLRGSIAPGCFKRARARGADLTEDEALDLAASVASGKTPT
jgi:hypothetical protein